METHVEKMGRTLRLNEAHRDFMVSKKYDDYLTFPDIW